MSRERRGYSRANRAGRRLRAQALGADLAQELAPSLGAGREVGFPWEQGICRENFYLIGTDFSSRCGIPHEVQWVFTCPRRGVSPGAGNSAEGLERPPLGVPVGGHVPAQEGLEGQAPGLAPVEDPGL
jgi:hypothetical protein